MLSGKSSLFDKQDSFLPSYQQFPFLNVSTTTATESTPTSAAQLPYVPLSSFQTSSFEQPTDLFSSTKSSFPLMNLNMPQNSAVSTSFAPKQDTSFSMANGNSSSIPPFSFKNTSEKLDWGNNFSAPNVYQDMTVPDLKLSSFESTASQNLDQLSMPWIDNNSLLNKVKPPTVHDAPNKIIEWFFALEQFYGLSGLWDRYPFQQFPCATLLCLPYEIMVDIWGEMVGSIIYNHLHIGDHTANVSTSSPSKQAIQPPSTSRKDRHQPLPPPPPQRPQLSPPPNHDPISSPGEPSDSVSATLSLMRSVRPQQRKSSTVSKRLDVVLFAEKFSNKAAARYFNIQPSQVRSYRRQKMQLLQTSPSMRRIGSGRKPVFPDVERQLKEWIKVEQNEGRSVLIKTVQDQAMVFATDADRHAGFKASVSWVRNFLRRNDVIL